MPVHVRGVPAVCHNMNLFFVPQLMQPRLYAWHPSWWERLECFCVLTVPIAPVLANYTNIVVNERPSAAVVWHIAAMELATMVHMQFLHAAEQGIVGLQFYHWQMGQGGCGVLAPLSSGVFRRVDTTALLLSSSFALSISLLPTWRVVAQWTSIGHLLNVYLIGFHTDLRTSMYSTCLKQ